MNDQPTPTQAPAGLLTMPQLVSCAERMGDKEESVLAAELFLLRRIAATSSDLVKAASWEEFREACGGIEPLRTAHAEATAAYEKWLSDGEA